MQDESFDARHEQCLPNLTQSYKYLWKDIITDMNISLQWENCSFVMEFENFSFLIKCLAKLQSNISYTKYRPQGL